MKTYLTDIIPKIQQFSNKLDELTVLTNQHWVVVDEEMSSKSVYIFRTNGELLISLNGNVEKAKWEYLGNNSLLIDKNNESYLFKHGFLDSNILALKVDSKNEYAFLVNENKYEGEINSVQSILDFLTLKYLEPDIKGQLREKLLNKNPPTKDVNETKSIETYHPAFDKIAKKSKSFEEIIGQIMKWWVILGLLIALFAYLIEVQL